MDFSQIKKETGAVFKNNRTDGLKTVLGGLALQIELEMNGRTLVVRLTGELDHHTADALRTAIEKELDRDVATSVLLNCLLYTSLGKNWGRIVKLAAICIVLLLLVIIAWRIAGSMTGGAEQSGTTEIITVTSSQLQREGCLLYTSISATGPIG